MRIRLFYLLKTYLLTVVIFIAAKVVFMLYNADGQSFSAGDVADVIVHGISLDLSTALYLVAFPFLVCIASIFCGPIKLLRLLLNGYYVLIAALLSLVFVADSSLYEFWHFKLDASCLQYLETPTDAMASVSTGYLVVRLLVFLCCTAIFYLLYSRPRWLFPRSRHRTVESIVAVACIPLIIIGIRGGLDESTTNIGQVYYSQNQFLNHSAVNPVFSFLSSFEKTAITIVDYDYYSQQECDRLMEGLYPSTATGGDTLLSEQHPDIVVILMESAGETVADGMPFLQKLKEEGINFSQCYANSWRTDRGTVCTYSGYPSFPTSSVMKMPDKTRHLPSIARTLSEAGYETSYFYGGDINFTNMRSYLISNGFARLTWKKDFSADEQATSKWGVRDDILFKAVADSLLRPHNRPQLIGFSTLSSHEPWDVPLQRNNNPILNSFCYLDDCIQHFVERLRQSPEQWKRTLLVLLPDHSIDFNGISELTEHRNLIPLVWAGGAVKKHRDITDICNQTDLSATLLAQLGLSHDDFLWSRNVLSPDYRYPIAVHNFNNGFTVIDSTGYMVYDLNIERIVAGNSKDSLRLEQVGKAVLQATTKDLKEK